MARNLMLIAMLICIGAGLYADADALKAEILSIYLPLKSFRADFTQVNVWPETSNRLTSKGTIYYDKEHLLLQYSNPKGQFLLALPESVHIWDPAENRELVMDGAGVAGRLRPSDIIAYYTRNAELKERTVGGLRILQVFPRDKEDIIKLEAAWDGGKITWLAYEDEAGNSVRYEFRNQKFNPALDGSLFIKSLPEGREILDARH